jgi:hypothetical protein
MVCLLLQGGAVLPPGLEGFDAGAYFEAAKPITLAVLGSAAAHEIGHVVRHETHPTGRERMGSHTLQTLQDPTLLLPCVCFRGGGFPSPKPHLT